MPLLLKTQANWLYEQLNQYNLAHQLDKLKHETYELKISSSNKKLPFHFVIKYYISPNKPTLYDYTVLYNPGFDVNDERYDIKGWGDLQTVFKQWLEYAKRELEAPDLWAEAAKTAQLFAGTTEAPDDKFTRTELAAVQGQLRQLQQSFAAAALPEAARQKLIELTETAAVKAEGLTKKDWQNWIIGGFISSITALALNPTQAQEVLKLVKAAFGGLFLH